MRNRRECPRAVRILRAVGFPALVGVLGTTLPRERLTGVYDPDRADFGMVERRFDELGAGQSSH